MIYTFWKIALAIFCLTSCINKEKNHPNHHKLEGKMTYLSEDRQCEIPNGLRSKSLRDAVERLRIGDRITVLKKIPGIEDGRFACGNFEVEWQGVWLYKRNGANIRGVKIDFLYGLSKEFKTIPAPTWPEREIIIKKFFSK